MKELISIIITTHNRTELLIQAIESVKTQSYSNFECFIIDDASDVDVRRTVSGVIDHRFTIVRIEKEESGGSNYARNKGISLANGVYTAFLDDDDTWEPTKLEKQIDVLHNSPEVKVCYCLRKFVYSNGGSTLENFSAEQEGDCSNQIFYNIIGTTSSLMIETQLLKEEMFDEELKFWQEYDLMIRLCQKTQVVCIKEHLVNYLINFNDKHRKTNKYDEWLQSVKYIDSKYKSHIERLCSSEIDKKQRLFYQDACNRLYSAGRKSERRKYLKKIYDLSGDKKHLIKYIFNIDGIDISHIKSKLNFN